MFSKTLIARALPAFCSVTLASLAMAQQQAGGLQQKLPVDEPALGSASGQWLDYTGRFGAVRGELLDAQGLPAFDLVADLSPVTLMHGIFDGVLHPVVWGLGPIVPDKTKQEIRAIGQYVQSGPDSGMFRAHIILFTYAWDIPPVQLGIIDGVYGGMKSVQQHGSVGFQAQGHQVGGAVGVVDLAAQGLSASSKGSMGGIGAGQVGGVIDCPLDPDSRAQAYERFRQMLDDASARSPLTGLSAQGGNALDASGAGQLGGVIDCPLDPDSRAQAYERFRQMLDDASARSPLTGLSAQGGNALDASGAGQLGGVIDCPLDPDSRALLVERYRAFLNDLDQQSAASFTAKKMAAHDAASVGKLVPHKPLDTDSLDDLGVQDKQLGIPDQASDDIQVVRIGRFVAVWIVGN